MKLTALPMLLVKVRSSHFSRASMAVYTKRVRNTAVKKLTMMPMISVVAKPWMGPVPNL